MRRSVGIAGLVVLLALVSRDAPVLANSVTGTMRLPGHVLPALALATRVAAPGGAGGSAATPAQPLTLTITLNRTDQQGFDTFLADLYDRRSPNFQHFLTQQAIADRFGPSQHAYDTVLAWLQRQGFSLVAGSANRLTLTVLGTRQAAEQAFAVTINDYQLGPHRFFANDVDPALPVAIAQHVQAINGLSDLAQPRAPAGLTDRINLALSCLPFFLGGILGTWAIAFGLAALLLTYTTVASLPGQTQAGVVDDTLALSSLFFGENLSIVQVEAGSFMATRFLPGVSLAACLWTLYNVLKPSLPRSLQFGGARAAGPAAPRLSVAASPQKIGLLEFDALNTSDVTDWMAALGLSPVTASQIASQVAIVPINGGVAQPGPGETEALVDIDTAILGDPSAKYALYEGPASTSFQAMFNAMLNDPAGPPTVIANSWAYCEDQTTLADVQSLDAILANAAAAHISVFNGAGDTGSTCLDGSPNTVAVPADSPHATAVGGTSPKYEPGLTYAGETWWDGSSQSPPSGQGGFGVSRFFTRPTYQNGRTSSSMRSLPDVAVDADPRGGTSICQADAGGCPTGLAYGGTSMAAPELAAATAVLNEALGVNLGQANPTLYQLATTDARSFHSAASMGSDFSHVGLGSPLLSYAEADLKGLGIGFANASASLVAGSALPFADGTNGAVVRVDLRDSNRFPVAGKTVALAPNAGSHAVISAPSGPSDPADGSVTFTVQDSTIESVTLTATDVSDAVPIGQVTLQFISSPATAGAIMDSPATVQGDGSTSSTMTVSLHNAQGQGASGKAVTIAQGNSHSNITATGATPGVTDSTGTATFSVTDRVSELVTYTAIDVTDGNLPVPGSAQVTFTSGPPPACQPGTPTIQAGYAVTTFASGFFNSGCPSFGPIGLAFDSGSNLYAADFVKGYLYKFGPSGGIADASTQVGTLAPYVSGLAFGKDGSLYAAFQAINGNYGQGYVAQIDPVHGTILRTLATLPCATGLATDPLSGDLFVTNFGFCNSNLYRIHNPTSISPTVSTYLSAAADGLVFAPDGTLYVMEYPDKIVKVSGTNLTPTTSAVLANVAQADGLALALNPSNPSQVQFLFVNANNGTITKVDLTTSPATLTPIFTGGTRGDFTAVGPDGCFYATQSDRILKITNADSTCPFTPSTSAPSLRLAPLTISPNPAQGTPQTFSATLHNVANPAGTAVLFYVSGANPQMKLVHADGSGTAAFTFSGAFSGADTVVATASPGGSLITSNTVSLTWLSGKHTTFTTLNQSATADYNSLPVTVTGNLTDVSANPPVALTGQMLAFSLSGASGQTCAATTDSTGTGACTITPSVPPGGYTLTVSFAGSSQYLASSDSRGFSIAAGSPPALQTIAPASGSVLGGQPVQLAGSNIQSGASVAIGGQAAPGVTVNGAGTSVTATVPGYVFWGDVNGDGLTTPLDALCILRLAALLPATAACPAAALQVTVPVVVSNPGGGSAVVPGGYVYQTADVNGDGNATPLDALCVLRAVAGLPVTAACPAPVAPGGGLGSAGPASPPARR